MIQRLRALQEEYFNSLKPKEENGSAPRPFASVGDPSTPDKNAEGHKGTFKNKRVNLIMLEGILYIF